MTSTNRMSGYAYSSQYNDAYDTASDRQSQIFWDALSIQSGSDRNSIALSIYHSVPEMMNEDEGSRYHVSNGSRAVIKVYFHGQMKAKFYLHFFLLFLHRIGKTITTKKMVPAVINYPILYSPTIITTMV